MVGFSGEALLDVQRLFSDDAGVGAGRLFDQLVVLIQRLVQELVLQLVEATERRPESLLQIFFRFHALSLRKTAETAELVAHLRLSNLNASAATYFFRKINKKMMAECRPGKHES